MPKVTYCRSWYRFQFSNVDASSTGTVKRGPFGSLPVANIRLRSSADVSVPACCTISINSSNESERRLSNSRFGRSGSLPLRSSRTLNSLCSGSPGLIGRSLIPSARARTVLTLTFGPSDKAVAKAALLVGLLRIVRSKAAASASPAFVILLLGLFIPESAPQRLK